MRTKFKVGELVEIHFMDHSENIGKTVLCVAIGRVSRVSRTEVLVQAWYQDDGTTIENGQTTYAIDRRTIEQYWRLERLLNVETVRKQNNRKR